MLHPRLQKHIRRPTARLTWRIAADPIRDPIEIAWDSDVVPLDHGLFLTRVVDGRQDTDETVDMVERSSAYVTDPAEYDIDLEPPQTLPLNLKHGWNLVSIPMQPAFNDIATLFQDRQDGEIWPWRSGQAQAEGYFTALDALDAKVGAWIYWPETTREPLPVQGRPLHDAKVSLSRGWNLVGPIVECAKPTSPFIDNQICWWDADHQRYESNSSVLYPDPVCLRKPGSRVIFSSARESLRRETVMTWSFSW